MFQHPWHYVIQQQLQVILHAAAGSVQQLQRGPVNLASFLNTLAMGTRLKSVLGCLKHIFRKFQLAASLIATLWFLQPLWLNGWDPGLSGGIIKIQISFTGRSHSLYTILAAPYLILFGQKTNLSLQYYWDPSSVISISSLAALSLYLFQILHFSNPHVSIFQKKQLI